MPFSDQYLEQVRLLMRLLPVVAEEECFALKGGTAINLFIRNMPRLSVDIDLTYLPVHSREESLFAIDAALKRIAERIRHAVPAARVTEAPVKGEDAITRLNVRAQSIQSKIEVTPVLRGCVYEPNVMAVSEVVEEAFGFAEMRVLSFADLYAGKLVAALDRQHPRDLFDVQGLLSDEGINEALRTAFVVYLVSHDRPMHEVLAPRREDISDEFARGFDGMTDRAITLESLAMTRERLVAEIVGAMPGSHRDFLLSFLRGAPDGPLLGVEHAQDLPAVR